MRKILIDLVLTLALSMVLGACSGTDADTKDERGSTGEIEPGDPSRGEKLYKQNPVGAASAPGCMTCHSLEEGQDLVGPSHFGIGNTAGFRVAGQDAEEYLIKAIVDPDAFVVSGFSAGVMHRSYGNELSDQAVADLVAFMLAQK